MLLVKGCFFVHINIQMAPMKFSFKNGFLFGLDKFCAQHLHCRVERPSRHERNAVNHLFQRSQQCLFPNYKKHLTNSLD